jgi:oxygen-independent coproporphyrinogen-3 oxidase
MKTQSDGQGGSVDEFIMLALRLSEGLRNDLFKLRFGMDIPERYILNAKRFEKMGLLYIDEAGVRLTPQGFLVSNYIISEILG